MIKAKDNQTGEILTGEPAVRAIAKGTATFVQEPGELTRAIRPDRMQRTVKFRNK